MEENAKEKCVIGIMQTVFIVFQLYKLKTLELLLTPLSLSHQIQTFRTGSLLTAMPTSFMPGISQLISFLLP